MQVGGLPITAGSAGNAAGRGVAGRCKTAGAGAAGLSLGGRLQGSGPRYQILSPVFCMMQKCVT